MTGAHHNMSNLTNQSPASTYGSLMNTAAAGGLTDILQVIQDGFGHPSPLSLSTDSLKINTQMGGGFFIDAVQLNATATQINSVCVDSSFSSFTTALSLPKGTTAQRPDPAENGEMRYNTTTNNVEGYEGGAWVNFGVAGYSPGSPTYLQDTHGTTNNLSVGTPAPTFLGQRNTVFGINAGTFVGTFNDSMFLGYNANPDTNNLDNACSIGANSVVSVSNAIVLGNATVPTKVGIGTTSPTKILHVANGDAVFEGQLGAGTTTPTARLHVKDGASYFENSNVGIGVAVPLEQLHVVGDSIFIGNNGMNTTNPLQPLHVSGKSYLNGNVGIGAQPDVEVDPDPDSILCINGTTKFMMAPNGILRKIGIIKGQEIRGQFFDPAGITIDFPINFSQPQAFIQLVVKVIISVVATDTGNYYSAAGESLCAALISPVNPTITVGASPVLFFNSSPPNFAPTGTWSISGTNLRLTLNDARSAFGDREYVVSYERFCATEGAV
jgi:hypothetical protein